MKVAIVYYVRNRARRAPLDICVMIGSMLEAIGRGETPATPQQTQDIINEVDRITELVPTKPGLNIPNHSAPNKTRWHQHVLFIRYPQGESNITDPTVRNLALVGWDNPDGVRTSFTAELTDDDTLQLTKQTFPPARAVLWTRPDWRPTPAAILESSAAGLARAIHGQRARLQERAQGTHIASAAEAEELLARLAPIEPAPEKGW